MIYKKNQASFSATWYTLPVTDGTELAVVYHSFKKNSKGNNNHSLFQSWALYKVLKNISKTHLSEKQIFFLLPAPDFIFIIVSFFFFQNVYSKVIKVFIDIQQVLYMKHQSSSFYLFLFCPTHNFLHVIFYNGHLTAG